MYAWPFNLYYEMLCFITILNTSTLKLLDTDIYACAHTHSLCVLVFYSTVSVRANLNNSFTLMVTLMEKKF